MGQFSTDTTVGVLLDTPETRKLIEDVCPEILSHPLLEAGRSFRLQDALPFMEGAVPADKLKAFLEALPNL